MSMFSHQEEMEWYEFPSHLIWIVGCSESMSGDKMNALNFAIKEFLAKLRKECFDISSRVVSFSDGAEWHIAAPTAINEFQWLDLSAKGLRHDMGAALRLVAQELMIEDSQVPCLILVSDSEPTDDYKQSLDKLMALPQGQKAASFSIAIGNNVNQKVLQQFAKNPRISFDGRLRQYLNEMTLHIQESVLNPETPMLLLYRTILEHKIHSLESLLDYSGMTRKETLYYIKFFLWYGVLTESPHSELEWEVTQDNIDFVNRFNSISYFFYDAEIELPCRDLVSDGEPVLLANPVWLEAFDFDVDKGGDVLLVDSNAWTIPYEP